MISSESVSFRILKLLYEVYDIGSLGLVKQSTLTSSFERREDSKDQEWIQSSTVPYPDHHMGK